MICRPDPGHIPPPGDLSGLTGRATGLATSGACLVGLGWLAWLVWRERAAGEDPSQPEVDDFASPAPQPEPEVGGEVAADPESSAVVADDLPAGDEPGGPERIAIHEPTADSDKPAVAEAEVAPESYRPSGQWANRQGDPDELLGELAQLRRDALKKVHRRPLYVMAEERGVPLYRRAFMTNGQLFDAILNAEGVSPGTVSPSPATVERVRELTLQMFDFGGE
jgi:hypothetical protein